MDIDSYRKELKENPDPPAGAVQVKLTNGWAEWVSTTEQLFTLHFGRNLVDSYEYARALDALIAGRDGVEYDVVIRERGTVGEVVARERVRAHDAGEAADVARALHLPRAKYLPAFVTVAQ